MELPDNSVIQVALSPASVQGYSDLSQFRPQRHLDGSFDQTLLPFGGGERVCLGKALAELEIRLMAVGLLQKVQAAARAGSGSFACSRCPALRPAKRADGAR